MRVEYEKPFIDTLLHTIQEARPEGRVIKSVYLNCKEWDDLRMSTMKSYWAAVCGFVPMDSATIINRGMDGRYQIFGVTVQLDVEA